VNPLVETDCILDFRRFGESVAGRNDEDGRDRKQENTKLLHEKGSPGIGDTAGLQQSYDAALRLEAQKTMPGQQLLTGHHSQTFKN